MNRNLNLIQMIQDKDDRVKMHFERIKRGHLTMFDVLRSECELLYNKDIYYSNQEETARNVANIIIGETEIIFQLVVAMTQSGKTGCMLAIIELCLKLSGCDLKINPNNYYIVTGLSSNDWTSQTKERMPTSLQPNVFHRNCLNKFSKQHPKLRDAVIIFDETHIAASENMTIDKLIKELGLRDMNEMRERNINIIMFSATPNSIINDIKKWENFAKKHIMLPGDGYKGLQHLLDNNRVFQAKDLYINGDPKINQKQKEREKYELERNQAMDEIEKIKMFIEEKYDNGKYHIIRTPSGEKATIVINRFREVCGRNFDYRKCDSKSDDNEIQEILKEEPLKHTFIFIKEHLRCAVTLSHKNRIGVLYERITATIQDSVIVQGLAGRATGYDVPDDMIVFTNIKSLETYINIWNNKFDDIEDMTFQGSKSRNQKSNFTDIRLYNNTGLRAEEDNDKIISKEDFEPVIKIFKTQEEAKQYYTTELKNIIGGRGPNKKDPDENGFYLSTIGKGNNRTRVRTTKEIYDVRKWNLNKNDLNKNTHLFTFHACYEDIKDKNTLQWWLIYKQY